MQRLKNIGSDVATDANKGIPRGQRAAKREISPRPKDGKLFYFWRLLLAVFRRPFIEMQMGSDHFFFLSGTEPSGGLICMREMVGPPICAEKNVSF